MKFVTLRYIAGNIKLKPVHTCVYLYASLQVCVTTHVYTGHNIYKCRDKGQQIN